MTDAPRDSAQSAEGEELGRDEVAAGLQKHHDDLCHWLGAGDSLFGQAAAILRRDADKVAALEAILEGADYITLTSGAVVLFDDDPVADILAAAAQRQGLN